MKSIKYNPKSIVNLPDNKPAVYHIQTPAGKDNYIGSAKKGRVRDRIVEHIGSIPGATVKIRQHSTIKDAQKNESRQIEKSQPKYNKKGK